MMLTLFVHRFIDQLAPGSYSMLVERLMGRYPDDLEHQITYLAKTFDRPREQVKQDIEKMQGVYDSINRFFDALPKADKEQLAQRFADLIATTISFVAVIR